MKQFEKNLIRQIVAENIAFSAIESPFFQQMINDIPGISMPFKSRTTLTTRISTEFELDRQKLIQDLAISSQTIALSLDGWTSKNDISILAVIGHWLTEDFVYKERVLEFAEIKGPKSGENMARIVLELLQELDIECKVITITSDNASNNKTLIDTIDSSLVEHFPSSSLSNVPRFHSQSSYIRCIAHILNWIVKLILKTLNSRDRTSANDAIELVSNGQYIRMTDLALARLRVLIIWISRSPERKSQWRYICRDNSLSDSLIPYDVDTRWNSTYLMLQASIKARHQISRWISSYSDIPQFTELDWDYLQQIAKVLQRFYEHTEYVSRSAPQMSYAVPIYYDLHDIMNDAIERAGDFAGLDESISIAVQSSLALYQKYYDFMDGLDVYYIALILNPRYKTRLLEQELGLDALPIIEHIKEMLNQQYPPIQSSPISLQLPVRQTLEARLLSKIQGQLTTSKSDIDRYFDDPIAQITEDIALDSNWLFNWWKLRKDEYPCMAAAARDYLAIPASEVACERLFSTGRDIIGIRRFSLHADTI